MSGKGSGRRPQEAPDEVVADEWARIFGRRGIANFGEPRDGIPFDSAEGRALSAHKDQLHAALCRSVADGAERLLLQQAQADHKDVE